MKNTDFDGANARMIFWNSDISKDPKSDAHSFEEGAKWQHGHMIETEIRLRSHIETLTTELGRMQHSEKMMREAATEAWQKLEELKCKSEMAKD